MPTGTIQSFLVPNYSGMLFNKGNTRTPFSALIGGRNKTTQHVRFVTGQEYTSEGGTQPAISETASLTAPTPTYITRTNKENVTQIFHESIAISYAKESNMQTLQGLNIAGDAANPVTELDWQIARVMEKIARDIEYTFINGTYVEATTDALPNKTRGMNEAITTNTVAAGGLPLNIWMINDLMSKIYAGNAPIDSLVLWVNPVTLNQLNADAVANGLTAIPQARNINGIQITTLLMPVGEVGVRLGEFIPTGTAYLFNPGVISPIEQPVPGKGNFFIEELAKVGAGVQHQIFGQLGLDHGPEWFHGKITGILPTFTPPVAP